MLKQEQSNRLFVNAFDELNERNRVLFNIPEIDRFLSFANKKNVCLIINSSDSKTTSFLNSIITNVCTNYHTECSDKSKRTVIIDAGNGNNLSRIYLELVQKSMSIDFDINRLLNQIIIVRAFTFHQLLNIIINELPRLLLRLQDYKIQISVLDLLDTLISSNRFKSNEGVDQWKSKQDFKCNEKLVDEMTDKLITISKDHFVITWYDNSACIPDNFSIPSKFNNIIEINSQIVNDEFTTTKDKKGIRNESQKSVVVKVKSDKTTFSITSNSTHYDFDNHSLF
jgi:hypothetical protein